MKKTKKQHQKKNYFVVLATNFKQTALVLLFVIEFADIKYKENMVKFADNLCFTDINCKVFLYILDFFRWHIQM